ncbi:hypothetical protein BGZ76_000499 [Entomortierella beljakovae]|nr:hypothetical protein BGZ76_000499 [Entomortierella beljakovae]
MGIVQDETTDTDGDTPLETDPTNRFQRLHEVLGEGAYKIVYRAFDQEEGVEVAWNQLRIDHLTKKEAQKILSEIEILESIRNDHIINFYSSWSTKAPNGGERVVFVTELMSSGTLKQYLKKTLKGSLKPKVLKSWCRQILQGLVYLHTHNPPIIHRDLKCDNIFINGNNGQLKIGDLGLAVVRHRTHVSSVLGTPEFMAPELYDEKYDEKVDIYAFGMCVLEMVTKEYPYSECTNQAQIYRKVTTGIKPQSLDHVQDPETKEFINRCLDHDDRTRPSAQELLNSDFLKPCTVAPLQCGSTIGFFNQNSTEMVDSPMPASINKLAHNSMATPTVSFPLPMPLSTDQPRTHPFSVKASPQQISFISIPPVEFTTTTTVDADNKTYTIHSNLLPQTPSFVGQDPLDTAGEQIQETQNGTESQEQNESSADTPTLHSHANSKTCSIQVVQYGEENGDQLNLKMICTCPVAGPRDATMAAGTHEIKFPFDLNVDTVEEVVAEMIREQILSGDDLEEATERIQALIDEVSERRERARVAKQMARSVQTETVHRGRPTSHRQLKNPSIYDYEQYSTSAGDQTYDHYSSVGSNASAGWGNAESPVESDQGYGTVPPHPPLQPPVITESTFPPLTTSHPPHVKPFGSPETTFSKQSSHFSYSEAVQHPTSSHPNSRDMSPVMSRPQSINGVDQNLSLSKPIDIKPALSNGTFAKLALRDAEAGSSDKKKKPGNIDDVGYTSPYRHGVSSSSINYHRRSPSVDASVYLASTASVSIPQHSNTIGAAMGSSNATQGKSSFLDLDSSTLPTKSTNPGSILSSSMNKSAPQLTLIPSTYIAVAPIDPLSLPSQAHESTQSLRANDHEPLLSLQPTYAPSPKPISPTPSELAMTPEAKKDIEIWTSKVQSVAGGGIGYMNGSNYSSCPEMSDDDENMDEDLKFLKEKQKLELETMRQQHVQQWESMVKLKEQKQERIRRKSDAINPAYPLASSPFPPQ